MTQNQPFQGLYYNKIRLKIPVGFFILSLYKLTNCPILLNTSFNVRGEPIVMNVPDAITCFVLSDIDFLVIGDFIVKKTNNTKKILKRIVGEKQIKTEQKSNVYSFI